jgi:hypothetical protein
MIFPVRRKRNHLWSFPSVSLFSFMISIPNTFTQLPWSHINDFFAFGYHWSVVHHMTVSSVNALVCFSGFVPELNALEDSERNRAPQIFHRNRGLTVAGFRLKGSPRAFEIAQVFLLPRLIEYNSVTITSGLTQRSPRERHIYIPENIEILNQSCFSGFTLEPITFESKSRLRRIEYSCSRTFNGINLDSSKYWISSFDILRLTGSRIDQVRELITSEAN